ncbi:hypothetical protein H4S07_001244 [Coemansia furcata]|uniref:Uncharacterized protein n=1 Tax=Coemansia furcata TaxID=417177 RepID=A0ACC1LNG3_9FUNG|nr:hypothetical protein H4S07_001244 [Coemansia furcata]
MASTGSYEPDEYSKHSQVVSDRVNKLTTGLEGLKLGLTFPELVDELGLRTEYKDYEDAIGDMFDSITRYIPSISPVSLGELSENGELEPKKTQVEKFKGVVKLMCDRAAEVDVLPKQYTRMAYDTLDGRSISMDDEPFTPPDVAFVFREKAKVSLSDVYIPLKVEEYASGPYAYRQHIERLVDYALALWNLQPTRTFVPVFFLRGYQLDLLVFTRGRYFLMCIGPVLLTDHCDRVAILDGVATSFRRLWFLLTLPAHRFGFLFDSQTIPRRLQIDASTIPVIIRQACDLDSTTVIVEKTIVHSVQITGCCTYLFNAKYKGNKALLKLAWTRTNRQPEGAVYRVLEAHSVLNIPKIYMSGVIVKDFDGYHLEFLVMEHCGSPIVEHIQGMVKGTTPVSYVDELVKRIISNVSTTLTEALAANILHRDISSGNIAIKDDTVYVIDWGCAKILRLPTDPNLETEIVKHWSFNWDKALVAEKHNDSSTGTPMYMSARLLLRAMTRGVYDDLESLLYVILDALSNRPRTGEQDGQPIGFKFYDSSNMAATRLAFTHSVAQLLKNFGVYLCKTSTLGDVLDAMQRFLFLDDGNHLCDRILDGKDFPCMFDSRSVISGNNTNADDSNDKQLDEWRVITCSHSKALVSNTHGLAKKDIGLVGKTKSKPGSPPKGTNKRVSDDKTKNTAQKSAKRRKH